LIYYKVRGTITLTTIQNGENSKEETMNRIARITWFAARVFWAFALLTSGLGLIEALYTNFVQKRIEEALILGLNSFLVNGVATGVAIAYLSWIGHPKPSGTFINMARASWISAFFFPVVASLSLFGGMPDVTGAGIIILWSMIPQYVALAFVFYGKMSKRGSRSRYRG